MEKISKVKYTLLIYTRNISCWKYINIVIFSGQKRNRNILGRNISHVGNIYTRNTSCWKYVQHTWYLNAVASILTIAVIDGCTSRSLFKHQYVIVMKAIKELWFISSSKIPYSIVAPILFKDGHCPCQYTTFYAILQTTPHKRNKDRTFC